MPEKLMKPEMFAYMASKDPQWGWLSEFAKKIFDGIQKYATTAATKVVQKQSFWSKCTGFVTKNISWIIQAAIVIPKMVIAIYKRDWKGLCKLIVGTLTFAGVTVAAALLCPGFAILTFIGASISQYIVEDIIIDNIPF
jgi:hypothetical protein